MLALARIIRPQPGHNRISGISSAARSSRRPRRRPATSRGLRLRTGGISQGPVCVTLQRRRRSPPRTRTAASPATAASGCPPCGMQKLDSCLQIGLIGGVNRVLAPHTLAAPWSRPRISPLTMAVASPAYPGRASRVAYGCATSSSLRPLDAARPRIHTIAVWQKNVPSTASELRRHRGL